MTAQLQIVEVARQIYATVDVQRSGAPKVVRSHISLDWQSAISAARAGTHL